MAGEQIVFIFKVFSVFFSLLFFFLILIVESKYKRLKRLMEGRWELSEAAPPAQHKSALQKRWEGVLHKAALKREADFKEALAEADAILEEVIKKIGFPNLDTALGQKGVNEQQISNIGQLREAHNFKRKLTKDPSAHISQEEVQRLITGYQAALKELQVLD